jgi:maltooligosyltrehalose trehalohydrolase
MEVVVDGVDHEMVREEGAYFSGTVPGVRPGARYGFRLDGGQQLFADPASRWQPEGPHALSAVVDPSAYVWKDRTWEGIGRNVVLYEMHIGTFTQEGTWTAARERLEHLADLGVDVLQVMPVADFPGDFGWGYDGVALFAPYHGYGEPDEFRAFVDAAHGLGIGVILDVVYNHMGPDGCYLGCFSDQYESRVHKTDWGAALNFDAEGAEGVREYVRANVRCWMDEYHLDGFRFDATQDIHDDGEDHILAALVREARAAAPKRRVLLIAESEPQDTRLVRSQGDDGFGFDALGNEDFHHTAVVALTGRRDAYYSPYLGTPQELVSAVKHGSLYQGQWYAWQRKARGSRTRGLSRRAFTHFLENHDQVANSLDGRRLHQLSAPGAWRALIALQLLGPAKPALFQGQEIASSRPFFYFADQPAELAVLTGKGRREFLLQFEGIASGDAAQRLSDPADPETFRVSKLDWRERELNAGTLALHRDLIRLRREEPFAAREPDVDGAVLSPDAFVLRWFGTEPDGTGDRILLVNLGVELRLLDVPEPLVAPPARHGWTIRWSSEDPIYGGRGTAPVAGAVWKLPGKCAVVLMPDAEEPQ